MIIERVLPSVPPGTIVGARGVINLFGREDFEKVVDDALEELPDDIAARLDNVVVVVEERDPDGEGLLGFYQGIPLPDRGMNYAGVLPDRISIFMDTHLALGLDHEGTSAEIRRTVLHEIAHHLGIDDPRLRELGWG